MYSWTFSSYFCRMQKIHTMNIVRFARQFCSYPPPPTPPPSPPFTLWEVWDGLFLYLPQMLSLHLEQFKCLQRSTINFSIIIIFTITIIIIIINIQFIIICIIITSSLASISLSSTSFVPLLQLSNITTTMITILTNHLTNHNLIITVEPV